MELLERYDASRLQGVRSDGSGGLLALCPCHDDHDPSLHLWTDDAGELAFSCLAGCTWPELKETLAGMGLPVDAHADRGGQNTTVIATYDYNDESGELAYQVLRYQPKSALARWFAQRTQGGGPNKRGRRIMIVAVARRLAIALWRYLKDGVIPEGAAMKAA